MSLPVECRGGRHPDERPGDQGAKPGFHGHRDSADTNRARCFRVLKASTIAASIP